MWTENTAWLDEEELSAEEEEEEQQEEEEDEEYDPDEWDAAMAEGGPDPYGAFLLEEEGNQLWLGHSLPVSPLARLGASSEPFFNKQIPDIHSWFNNFSLESD